MIDSRPSILKIFALAIILILLVAGKSQTLSAAEIKTISGQAVLTEGVEKARKESISDALGKALSSHIYGDMAVDHKFEQQIHDTILKNRNLYIKKFEIQSERTLGELYQIELRVELKSELIERDLKTIVKSKKRTIEELTLVVLPSESDSGTSGYSPVLEPTALELVLKQSLTVYGFSLTGAGELSQELKAMFVKLMRGDKKNLNQELNASWFKGLLAGDLIVVIQPFRVREERIVSLRKSFWHSQADIVFIDIKNNTIKRLPTVGVKVISGDYVSGMERLTKELNLKIRERVTDRLLNDYVVSESKQELVILKCVGFRQPVDFIAFKERLQSLQTVKSVTLKEFAAGFLELEIKTLNSAVLLGTWINDFASEGLGFSLNATASPVTAITLE
ncbi:MAG: hypothetical protein KAG92_10785, partial [Deltaproteobacteria bacterium]|nr:hypothetical protein [Deltaproteobacteria bacterium]